MHAHLGFIKLDKELIDVPPCLYGTLDLEMISPLGGFARAERPSDKIGCGSIRLQKHGKNANYFEQKQYTHTHTPKLSGTKEALERIVLMLGQSDPIPGLWKKKKNRILLLKPHTHTHTQ